MLPLRSAWTKCSGVYLIHIKGLSSGRDLLLFVAPCINTERHMNIRLDMSLFMINRAFKSPLASTGGRNAAMMISAAIKSPNRSAKVRTNYSRSSTASVNGISDPGEYFSVTWESLADWGGCDECWRNWSFSPHLYVSHTVQYSFSDLPRTFEWPRLGWNPCNDHDATDEEGEWWQWATDTIIVLIRLLLRGKPTIGITILL